MQTYVAFLRGINVGGNSLIKMSELTAALSEAGLQGVRTYIQSGNVIFESDLSSVESAKLISRVINQRFELDVRVVAFSKGEWLKIIAEAPKWWGTDDTMKHNLLIMIPPFNMPETVSVYGQPKPDIERMEAGKLVVYQALSLTAFGRTTGGKIAGNPIYKQMTIRNYNTAAKLAKLLEG